MKRPEIKLSEDVSIITFDPFTEPVNKCKSLLLYYLYILLSYIYSCFVLCVILIEPICIIITCMRENNILNLPKLCFLLIGPVQFCIGNNYYSKQHFYYTLKSIKNTKLTFFNNEDKLFYYTLFITLISIIISIIIIIYDFSTRDIFKEPIYVEMGTFGVIIVILSWVYSRLIIFLNLLLFFTTFSYHKNELENTALILSDKDWLKSEQFIVSDLCYQILKLKTKMEESIIHLESIYTFSTMLGTIGIGVFIQTLDNLVNKIFMIVCIIIFFIIQCVFIHMMYYLTSQRKTLLKIIQSNKFTKAFLKRNGKNTSTPKDPFKTLIAIHRFSKLRDNIPIGSLSQIKLSTPEPSSSNSVKTPDWVRDNGSSIDWIVLYTILKERWVSFSFFGLTFEDGDAIKKGFALSAMLVATNKLTPFQ